MLTSKRLFVLVSLVVLFGLVGAACGPAPTPQVIKETVVVEKQVEVTKVVEKQVEVVVTPTAEPKPEEKKTLIYVHTQEVRWLDPARMTESQSGNLARNIYSRLLDQSYDASQIMPDLAEKWEVSDDGLVYTFHLRQGVKFHDGMPLTAEDVVYSFERALAINQGDTVFLEGHLEPGKTVALDDSTVQITLNDPWAPFLNLVASPRTLSILPKAWVEANKTADDPWAQEYVKDHANGTGPFKFVEWVPKQYARLERYEDYYKGPAKVEVVLYQLSADDTTTRLALEKGDVDIVEHLPDDMMRVLAQNSDLKVLNKPIASFMYWIFNNKMEPFTDKRVRQAFAYTIDYDAIMENLVKEGGVRMNSPVMSDMFAHDDSIPPVQRDVEKAKKLLAEAGYSKGLTVDMPYVQWGLIPQLAVVIQSNLSEIGVTAKLQEIPLNTLIADIEEGKLAFFVWNSSPAYPHPDALFVKLTSSGIGKGADGNIAYYSNPEVDKAVEEARAAAKEADQIAAYKKAQQLVMEDMPWLLLYEENQYRAIGSWVTGFDFGAFNHVNFWEVDVNK